MKSIITITGDPGSGKSTVGKLLAAKLSWNLITIGALQRKMAEKMRMDVNEFNKFMDNNPMYDEELDKEIQKIGETRSNVIVDARIAWHWIKNSFKVYLYVDNNEAAKRIFNDQRQTEKYSSMNDAKNKITERKKIEVQRLKDLYGIDFSDMKNYELIIDTTNITPELVCSEIIKNL